MTANPGFHVVTVGWPQLLIDKLCADIAKQSAARFSHIAHPRHTASDWSGTRSPDVVRFFRETTDEILPAADSRFLASLEQEGVPTIHNMILGDRIVCRLAYSEAERYATFIAKSLRRLFEELRPSVVIGGFDSLHGGLSLAVARRLGIPWFALHFSVLPPGLACFCSRLSPASRVQMTARPSAELRVLAESALRQFEGRKVQAYAYSPPKHTIARTVSRIPARVTALRQIARKSRDREFARFTEVPARYDAIAAVKQLWRMRRANRALAACELIVAPPSSPFVLFGLHMQPESSIDVWAPFFSNQLWVIELLSRSIPPSHKLLVKVHKSDVSNYSTVILDRMRSFPGVELVSPSADARGFIERADLLVGIQGTMGLEAALLGRPVIMLGDSPVSVFPNSVRIGALDELPALVRQQLASPSPTRDEIVEAFASYLAPFMPASHNDWRTRKSTDEVTGFVRLFDALQDFVESRARPAMEPVT